MVVIIAKIKATMPRAGWTISPGYLVASQPAISRIKTIGSIDNIRVVLRFIKSLTIF